MLMKWRSALEEEVQILSELYQGFIKPNEEDPFYHLIVSPKMDECEGPLRENKIYVLVAIDLMRRRFIKAVSRFWIGRFWVTGVIHLGVVLLGFVWIVEQNGEHYTSHRYLREQGIGGGE